MLICHCQGVNDRRIREEVGRGARTVAQIGRACGAAVCCGGCARAVAEIVEESAGVAAAVVENIRPGQPRQRPGILRLPTVSADSTVAEIPLAAE